MFASGLRRRPHHPIVSQSARAGPLVARRIRRDASAAPRMIVQDAASATSIPTTPITVPHSVLSSSPVARPSEARSGTPRPAMTNTGTPISLERARRPSARRPSARCGAGCARASAAATRSRGARRGCGAWSRRRGCGRRRGTAPRAGRPSGRRTGTGRRSVRRYSRGSRAGRATRAPRPCSGAPARSRRGGRASACARSRAASRARGARDLDRVEVAGDLVVVPREQLQPLDRVVDLLEDVVPRPRRPRRFGRIARHGLHDSLSATTRPRLDGERGQEAARSEIVRRVLSGPHRRVPGAPDRAVPVVDLRRPGRRGVRLVDLAAARPHLPAWTTLAYFSSGRPWEACPVRVDRRRARLPRRRPHVLEPRGGQPVPGVPGVLAAPERPAAVRVRPVGDAHETSVGRRLKVASRSVAQAVGEGIE